MRIFITGGSGFIGQRLVPLLSKDHQVIHLQNDLRDHAGVTQELVSANPEIVIHLAARTEVERSFYEPTLFSDINYAGSINLIEAAAQCDNLRMFLFASTMEVYGWQPISGEVRQLGHTDKHAVFDELTPPNPNAPYAVAKFGVEKYLEYKHRSQGFPFSALRQTNCYGRHDNDFFVTEQIISQMLIKDEIQLGDPLPYRNFIYIDDLVAAWISLLDNLPAVEGRIFTVGPDQPIQIRTWAEMIAAQLSWQGDIEWHTKPHRPGEIYWLNSASTALTSATGWQSKVDATDGIARTIEIWQRKLT